MDGVRETKIRDRARRMGELADQLGIEKAARDREICEAVELDGESPGTVAAWAELSYTQVQRIVLEQRAAAG